MYCKDCGAQIPDGTKECPRCGSKTAFEMKDLLTKENAELLIAFTGLVPLAISIMGAILGILDFLLIFRIIIALIEILAMLITLAAAGAAGYFAYKSSSLRNTQGYYAIGIGAFSFILMILILSDHSIFILNLICAILALDVISRVVIQKTGLASPLNFAADYAVYKTYIDKVTAASKMEKGMQAAAASNPNSSYFDGKGIDCLGYMIIYILFSSVTLGLATPWLQCMLVGWRISHTVINGRRLTFTGKGDQLLVLWIKWVLLSLVTLGIYAYFAYVDYLKWEAKHTFFEDEHPAQGSENPGSVFDGNTFEYIGTALLGGLLTMFTLCIGFPWAACMLQKWKMKHTVISGYRLSFDGNGLQYLGESIIIAFFSLITLGIYSYWGIVRLNKWIYRHTFIDVPAAVGAGAAGPMAYQGYQGNVPPSPYGQSPQYGQPQYGAQTPQYGQPPQYGGQPQITNNGADKNIYDPKSFDNGNVDLNKH